MLADSMLLTLKQYIFVTVREILVKVKLSYFLQLV